ncbi:MAG: DNA-directed polymerase subunit beta, partial [Actinomycetota bacterium]|nr:DNA-directed polymerase subunit beta [Actinomycetota bacterium]
MSRLVERKQVQTIKAAKKLVDALVPEVWDVLEEVIGEHPVLLNRAPTLHRLGIQAFEPILVEGKAIQIHPLVCAAFNADFDGDQMAVHLPLSAEAQAEARVLMLSANNVLSPAHGRPLTVPSQDMVIGIYYLTEAGTNGQTGEPRRYSHLWEIERALDTKDVEVHTRVLIRDGEDEEGKPAYRDTTVGRLLFESALPPDYAAQFGHVTSAIKKRHVSDIVERLVAGYPKAMVAKSLDAIKDLGFRYATQSGLTISMDDVKTPPEKESILDKYEKEADKIESQFRKGIITDDERRQKEVETWTNATQEVRRAMERTLGAEAFNPIDMMVGSGARGNVIQVQQIAGMRGLVANPRGEIIPRPIKSNFREGLSVLEYFISTHGARKGLADTALRTADSGYLTRRLVDVAQELIVREVDCGTTRGLWLENIRKDEPNQRFNLETRLFGRVLVEPATLSDGTVIPTGTDVGEEDLARLRDDPGVTRLRVRSVLTCEAAVGVCGTCYGRSLATGKDIELGEAVGVIAAQSIGEPGTQLTMRTFHTGGIAGIDITHGLPRVVELFEARTPKGKAVLARTSGVVRMVDDEVKGRVLTIVADDGTEEAYPISNRDLSRLLVHDGQEVEAGHALVEGPKDPKELLEIKGIRETQQYLVDQVQEVYRPQGVPIHDKHIELIVRQMLRRVSVAEAGDSEFLPGERVDSRIYAEVNRGLVQEGKRPAEGRPELMGITKASLATESWLSAASFQETTRVLTEAAIEGKRDQLLGLKENIIIGKLIPAGTGMTRYRSLDIQAPDYEPLSYYSSDTDQDLAAWLANLGSGDGSATDASAHEVPSADEEEYFGGGAAPVEAG